MLFPKAPAYRAFFSVSLFLLARIFEKPYSSIKAILLAFSISLLLFPHWVSNVGFWLSYVASLSLILYYGNKQPVENQFLQNFLGKFLGLEATLVVTLSITPILVHSFHYFSLGGFLYAFPLTLLVQLYILSATFNLFTLFSFQPTLDIQEKLVNLFMFLFHKFPEKVYFKASIPSLELAILLTLFGLLTLALPIKRKLMIALSLFLFEIFLFKIFPNP
jgi:ComEC/Rec2-related protein